MISIGSVQLDTNIFLAPLSGCSDLAFRLIAREGGAKFCFFEMVDAHSLRGPHDKRFDILKTTPQDAPIGAQLVGETPELMGEAARILLDHVPAALLDINSACPVKKVIKKGAGAGLLNAPETLFRIIETVAAAVAVPVTVKLRIGFHAVNLPALLDVARRCEQCGAAALFVHGRTRDQLYSGGVDYAAIRAVKQAVSIPVFGSGNVFDPILAKKMLDETGCDGLLVARGAFGNPWIFSAIDQYLRAGDLPPDVSALTRKATLKRHLAYIEEFRAGQPKGKIGFMRKVALWYLKGFPNAAKARGHVTTAADYASLLEFIETALEIS